MDMCDTDSNSIPLNFNLCQSLCPYVLSKSAHCNFHQWVLVYFLAFHPSSPSSFLSIMQTLLLPFQTSSSSSFFQPTCENIYLSSPLLMYSPWRQTKLFPYLLPLSLSPLSFPVFLILSISLVCKLSQKRHTQLRHTLPLSFVNTVSSDGKKLPYLPTYLPPTLTSLCQIPPQRSRQHLRPEYHVQYQGEQPDFQSHTCKWYKTVTVKKGKHASFFGWKPSLV